MTLAYLVVEGETDEVILKRVLPEELTEDVQCFVSGDKGSASSAAASIVIAKRKPVAVVVDADTDEPQMISERDRFLRFYIGRVAAGVRFDVFIAVPQIEIVFFEDRALAERLAGRALTDPEWELARVRPHRAMERLLHDRGQSLSELLDGLAPSDLDAMRAHPLIAGLSEFLAGVRADSAQVAP